MKLLIASALIAVMPVTATAQKMIPDKCNNLHVTYDAMDVDQYSKNVYINAAIHNDDQYALTNATFYFDLLIDDNVKVGEAAQVIAHLG